MNFFKKTAVAVLVTTFVFAVQAKADDREDVIKQEILRIGTAYADRLVGVIPPPLKVTKVTEIGEDPTNDHATLYRAKFESTLKTEPWELDLVISLDGKLTGHDVRDVFRYSQFTHFDNFEITENRWIEVQRIAFEAALGNYTDSKIKGSTGIELKNISNASVNVDSVSAKGNKEMTLLVVAEDTALATKTGGRRGKAIAVRLNADSGKVIRVSRRWSY